MVIDYIRLLRPKHYLKNLLVFLPLVFSGNFLDRQLLLRTCIAFIFFSLTASAVYIINDIRDAEKDKLHPSKKNRPISSGKISKESAMVVLILIMGLLFVGQLRIGASEMSILLLGVYFVINLLYSFGLKNIPVVDVSILAVGFLIRVFYGAEIVDIVVSEWLYLAVLAFSYYMGFGKRRNEFRKNGSASRKVNEYYNQEFLDKNMYMAMCLAIVFYSLWTVDQISNQSLLIWTVPFVMAIFMTYSLAVEKNDSDGDPINVVTKHKPLLLLVGAYIVVMLGIVYII